MSIEVHFLANMFWDEGSHNDIHIRRLMSNILSQTSLLLNYFKLRNSKKKQPNHFWKFLSIGLKTVSYILYYND